MLLARRASAEDVAHTIYEALVFEVAVFDACEFFEQASLLARQGRRRAQRDRDEEVAVAASAKHGHPLSLHTEDRPGLRARRNLQRVRAVQSLDRDLCAERGLREGDGHGRIKIAALSLETFVFFDVDNDVEVARRAALRAALTLAHQTQT